MVAASARERDGLVGLFVVLFLVLFVVKPSSRPFLLLYNVFDDFARDVCRRVHYGPAKLVWPWYPTLMTTSFVRPAFPWDSMLSALLSEPEGTNRTARSSVI
jgi:hypothetical protein